MSLTKIGVGMSDLIKREDVLNEIGFHIVGATDEKDRNLLEKLKFGIKFIPSAEPERKTKVEQAVPNMTILKRKVDLQSILQAIKTDKISVWLNYDGKICFQNTETGNEISVEPYYDMEGNTNNE